FVATGVWRGELTRRLGARNPLRFFAPPLLVLNVVTSLIVGGLQVAGVLTGTASLIASVVHLGPLLYLGVVLGAALSGGGSVADRLRYVLALLTMHLSWGTGLLIGSVRGGGSTVDRSRAT